MLKEILAPAFRQRRAVFLCSVVGIKLQNLLLQDTVEAKNVNGF